MKSNSTNEYVGYVYKVVNILNDKIYIGETLTSIDKRFKQHCSGAFNKKYWNYHFYRAIRKYGVENFTIVKLEKVINTDRKLLKETILKLEEQYIKEYDSFNIGYNSNSGGRKYKEVCAETKKLQSKRKLEDPLTKERLCKARSCRDNEIKIIAYNYNTGEMLNTFKSIKKAAEYYNIDSSGITKVCKRTTNFLGRIDGVKISWRYAEDLYEIPYSIKVYNISGILLNKFITFADAAKFYNIKYQETITRCCKGKTKCTGRKKSDKLVWRYINDDFNKYK